ncbi:MAG TPA: hypothetical protein VGA88_12925 [Burkholderiales bacterium]
MTLANLELGYAPRSCRPARVFEFCNNRAVARLRRSRRRSDERRLSLADIADR